MNKDLQKLQVNIEEMIEEARKKNPDYKYEDGFTPENMEEILRTHPAFMTKMPTQEDIDNNPLLTGLQQIKYDPDDTPTDQAQAHKDDGNWHFKHKLYKKAGLAYTAGIRIKAPDKPLNAALYSNRAASNFYLKNYRSAIQDSIMSLIFEPKRIKSLVRCAQCCLLLEKYEKAIDWSNQVLEIEPTNEKAKEYLMSAKKGIKIKQRDLRKHQKEMKVKGQEMSDLVNAIKSRGIKLIPHPKKLTEEDKIDGFSIEDLKLLKSVDSKTPSGSKVHLVDSEFESGVQRLVWPVLFTYPEYQVSEIVEEFHEDSIFTDHLKVMFEQGAEWDLNRYYKLENLEVYHEKEGDKLCQVNSSNTLGQVLSNGEIDVQAGTPVFIILSNESSKFYNHFKENYKK